MPEIVITEVDSGRFFTKTEKVWGVAASLIRDFLVDADAPAGKYAIRVHKQVRWMGNPTSPIKVSRYEGHGIILTVKPPSWGNGSSWEYLLNGQFPDWDAKMIFHHLRRHISPDGPTGPAEPDPEVNEQVEPEPQPQGPRPKMSLTERIAALEATASRNKPREAQITKLTDEIAIKRRAMAALQTEIDQLEAEQLRIMDEIEGDKACHEAQQAIAALEGLLA